MSRYIELMQVYEGSNGDATKALYDELAKLGPRGDIALNLFRAHKASSRAKVYRGGVAGKGSYKSMAYERKAWAIGNLCTALTAHAAALGIRWGWAEDKAQEVHSAILYVETPHGQISFHTAPRGPGPNFPGEWDGVRNMGPTRICHWIADLLPALH